MIKSRQLVPKYDKKSPASAQCLIYLYLSLKAGLSVRGVELDDPAVLAAPRDDGAVLQDADGEDGAVVDLPQGLGHRVVAPAPHEHVAVRVACIDGDTHSRTMIQKCAIFSQFQLSPEESRTIHCNGHC